MQAIFEKFSKGAEIVAISEALQTSPVASQAEQTLRQLESEILRENFQLIIEIAESIGTDIVKHDYYPRTKQEACVFRYLYVPILYKLGVPEQAAKLAQLTFEFLFPALHQTIENVLANLWPESIESQYQIILNEFNIVHPDILQVYSRKKSTHSIWKKVTSVELLETLDANGFAKVVKDFIGVRWNMKVKANENRYDALINGLRIAPTAGLVHFRNQQLPQQKGFDCEPVMKLTYVKNNLPIELQLLGGNIELYLIAKGYANHKVGFQLPPQCETLPEHTWQARLGMCLNFSEENNKEAFQKLMLAEVTGAMPEYDEKQIFILDEAPLKPANLKFKFINGE